MSLFSIPNNPVPEGAVDGYIITPDGVRLRFARWMPEHGLKGTVAIFPGRCEFIEKYFEVVRELRARGFAVAVLDWRGQGGSQRLLRNPRKGHVRRFCDYLNDVDTFAREVLLPDCPAPHYALAHSMGGTIMLHAALEGRRWFDRMVLSAPMLGIDLLPVPALSRPGLAVASMGYFSRCFVPGGSGSSITDIAFAGNALTSDKARFDRTKALMQAYPSLALGAPTVGWLHHALNATDKLAKPEVISRIRQPLLMVAAGREKIVSNRAIEHMSSRLIAGAHVVVPGARHELLNERDIFREQFWAAFDAFVPGTPVI